MINQFSILLAHWTIRAVRFVLVHPTLLACGYFDRTVSLRCATLKETSLFYTVHGGKDRNYIEYYFVLWSLTRIGGLRFECTPDKKQQQCLFSEATGTLNLFVAILWYDFSTVIPLIFLVTFKCFIILSLNITTFGK